MHYEPRCWLPLYAVYGSGAMVNQHAVRLLGTHFTAVVVIMLDLLCCCPAEDVWGLVQGKGGTPSFNLAAAAVVDLEHRSGAGIL